MFNTPKRKKYGKLLARSHNPSKSLAIQVLKDTEASKWIVKGIGKVLRFELKQLCSIRVNSVQRSKDKEHLRDFPWEDIVRECLEHCPVLANLLLASTATKKVHPNQKNVLCMITCVLSKFHCSKMSLFQRLVSALLFSGHVGTAVCIIYLL